MNKKYQIIYADPPWSYKVWTAKGGHKSASAHYKTMELKDICNLPIKDIADDDCTLFMWATMPNLLEAFEVIKVWGFTYKTCAFNWIKVYPNGRPVIGLGYWTRSNSEVCLLATKGKPKRIDKNVSQIVQAPPSKHSEKPEVVRELIVKLMGNLPRIELFVRPNAQLKLDKTNTFDGWDVWGNEVKSDIELNSAPENK